MPARFVKPEAADSQDGRPLVTVIGLVRQLSRAMIDELIERLAAAGFSDVTASHHPVFENIDPGGTRLTDLAARAGMTHQSMGELVAVLERRGYLERRADPTDGRARLVCLTRQGRQLVRRAVREISDIEAAWQRRFQAAGCQDFTGALHRALAEHAAEPHLPGGHPGGSAPGGEDLPEPRHSLELTPPRYSEPRSEPATASGARQSQTPS